MHCHAGPSRPWRMGSRHRVTAMSTLHFHLQPQYKYELFHVNFTSFHCTGRYELNKLTSLLMCGFIAQLVERRNGSSNIGKTTTTNQCRRVPVTSNEVHFVSLAENFTVNFQKFWNSHLEWKTKQLNGPCNYRELRETGPRELIWWFVYVTAWARGQLRINFTSIFKVFTKLLESRSDEGNLENFENTSEIIP